MEQTLTISGNQVIYHATKYAPKERVVDFSPHMDLITSEMGKLISDGKQRVIGIEGMSGTGKTGLAKLLGHDGVNVKVIDVCSLLERGEFNLDICHLLGDSNAVYVIDELSFTDANCIPLLESHVENDGTLLFLVQDKREVTLKLNVKWMKLSRTGLTVV